MQSLVASCWVLLLCPNVLHKARCDGLQTRPVEGGAVGKVFGAISAAYHWLRAELRLQTSFLGRWLDFGEGALPGMKMGGWEEMSENGGNTSSFKWWHQEEARQLRLDPKKVKSTTTLTSLLSSTLLPSKME